MSPYRGRLDAYDTVTDEHVGRWDVGSMSIEDARGLFDAGDESDQAIVGGVWFVGPEQVEWLHARIGEALDPDRLNYQFTLRGGPSADDADVTGERPEALPAFRGTLEAFDKVSEILVVEQDVGLWSIDEFRRVFLDGVDDPIYDGGFDVSRRQAEWIVAKAGIEFDFGRFDYQISLWPET